MIWHFPSAMYYELNIKCMSERDFYEYIRQTIDQKHVVTVSNDYFQEFENNQIFRNAMVDSIFMIYGLDSIKNTFVVPP